VNAAPAFTAAVGLCSICRSAQPQPNARGNTFWRCLRADEDRRFLKYPPLPVRRCPGFEALPGAAPPAEPGP
jgi:hypothetical protein